MKNQKKFKKNKPLTPPDISDPLFPYGPKNKHLQNVLGVRPETKKRKDVIQTPTAGFLEEVQNLISDVKRLLKESMNPDTLVIYDFDHTLFKSPLPANPDPKWWGDIKSMTEPVVPEVPTDEWWNTEVVNDLVKDLKDSSKHVIVMTGRKESFKERLSKLLKTKGLDVPEFYTNYMGDDTNTLNFKIRNIKKILSRLPSVKTIVFYDDRKPHLDNFKKTFAQYTDQYGEPIYNVETHYILHGKQFRNLYEQEEPQTKQRSPLSLSIFGAPAAGKSYLTKQITKLSDDPKIKAAEETGSKLSVDDMRDRFKKLSPRTQLTMMFESYYFFKNLTETRPEAYQWWEQTARESIMKHLAPKLEKYGVFVRETRRGITVNGKSDMKEISSVIRKLSDEQLKGVFTGLDPYHAYKVAVRYYMYITITKQKQMKKDVVFDETGGDALRQIDVLKGLHREKYVTDILFFHARNVAVNMIQAAYRIVTGDDGYGRDAGQNLIDTYNELEREIGIYKKNAEVVHNTDSKQMGSDQKFKRELSYANVEDDEQRGDKPIDLYTIVDIGTPEEAYARMTKMLRPQQKKVFDAFLLAQTRVLKVPAEAASAITRLVEVDESEVYPILYAAIHSGKYDYSEFAGLGNVKGKGLELLKNVSKVFPVPNQGKEETTKDTTPDSSQLRGLSETKKKAGILSEMPHVSYEPYSEFEKFDSVGAGVLDFSLELLTPAEYRKYSKGFNIVFDGNKYYVDPGADAIKKVEIDNGKPEFANWEEYVNVRERSPTDYRKKVAEKKALTVKLG